MKKSNKKGFTIVELVIVIAVIAILSAVLIPTFSNITTKAKDSTAIQEARNVYTEYYSAKNGELDEADADFVYKADAKRFIAIVNGQVQDTVYTTEASALAVIIVGETLSNAETKKFALKATYETLTVDSETLDFNQKLFTFEEVDKA